MSLRRPGVFGRLYLGLVVLIIATTGGAGMIVARKLSADAVDETRESLRARARLLRSPALAAIDDPAPFQREAGRLGREIETRLTLIAENGRVVADSERDTRDMDDHSTRPEVVEARRTGEGSAIRHSATIGETLMYLAVRLGDEARPVGYIRTAVSLAAVDRRVDAVERTVALAALLAAVVAAAFGWLFARRITAPLRAMTVAAGALAAGERHHDRVPVRTSDEVGVLARAFNEMAAELERRVETITRDRNKLHAILSGLVEGVIAIDRDERIVHLNGAAAAFTHADRENSVGRSVREVVRVPEICEALSESLTQGSEARTEIELIGAGGDRRAMLHSSALEDGQGRVVGALLVIQDVSEHRRLEAVRRDFVANVSHELKTPITAIRGIVETMLDDGSMPEATRVRFQEKIRDQSLRLSALVVDLLTLARVESREGLAGFEKRLPIDLRGPAREAIADLAAAAELKGVQVSSALPDEAVRVRGDDEALRQVVHNLLDNAIKYTPQRGEIRVEVRAEEGWAIVEVSDTGIGIEPAHVSRIFERFYRVDKARSRELGGTGLGLSIVKHLIAAHDGTTDVESKPGQGSTFRIRIPLGV